MSVKGIHWAQEMRGVCPFRKALLFALGERHHKDQNIVVADQVMLAEDAGMSDRTVRKYLRLLEQDGLVSSRVVGIPGGGRRTHYMLAFDRRKPQETGPDRKAVPVSKPAQNSGSVRKEVPVRKDDQTGSGVPDRSGTCVPFPKDTIEHEEPLTPSGDEIAFEEIWVAFRKLHTANHHQSRVAGKAKTLKLFLRKAKGGKADKIRETALAEVARQKANKGGFYLKGLIPWLNLEPWDTGEEATAAITPKDWEDRLWFWSEQQRWQSDWGPAPNQPGYRGPKVVQPAGLFA